MEFKLRVEKRGRVWVAWVDGVQITPTGTMRQVIASAGDVMQHALESDEAPYQEVP